MLRWTKGITVSKTVEDLTGMTFGRLTVVEREVNNKYGQTQWRCVCSCGAEKIVLGKFLRNGHTQSCGCLNREINSKRSLIDRTGERYGRLTVVSRADDYVSDSGAHHVMWNCLCDCGKMTVVDVCQLVGNHTKSCGCLHAERLREGNVKHGGYYDRLYKVYANMKSRCLNENSDDYKYYGGRGITICDEWLNDYLAFKKWAYINGYDENAAKGKCTIDRIDVNKGYSPDNCRWVDMAVQSKNRRNVIKKENDKCP